MPRRSLATAPGAPPSITASAVGDTRIVPDRAMVSVAVESQGETAAKAGADNAARQARVIDAVKAAGVAAAQIRTSGYNVFPEYAQSSGKGPRISGYRAHNTVQVEVRDIDAVGKIIDAALGAGATNIGGVSLFASNTDAARKEALQKAVAKARVEAETVATAAGGSLGPLLELAIEPSERRSHSCVRRWWHAMASADADADRDGGDRGPGHGAGTLAVRAGPAVTPRD